MDAIREVYKDLPDMLMMPKWLHHKQVEVILLPLDSETGNLRISSPADSPLARYAGGWMGESMVRESSGNYEVREDLG